MVGGVQGRVVHPGQGRGRVLALEMPLSFWGGVDPKRGTVTDPRHPDHGGSIAGRVLVLPAAIGSSSSSAIMLELIREGCAPAAVVMGRADAILALGVVVAEELGYPGLPIVEVGTESIGVLVTGADAEVTREGRVELLDGAAHPIG